MSTMTSHLTIDDVREAFTIASSGNWRDYPEYVDKILDARLALDGDA